VEHRQVNDIQFHPSDGTLATVGSDGRFLDKDARTKLNTSEAMQQPITTCCINSTGDLSTTGRRCVFAANDAAQGHHYNEPTKPRIDLHACMNEMTPKE